MPTTLTRAFAWLAEFDLTVPEPDLYEDMEREWADLMRTHGIEDAEAFKRAVLCILDVLHPLVTNPAPVFVESRAILGAQGIYATLIRGVFGREFYAWVQANSQGTAD